MPKGTFGTSVSIGGSSIQQVVTREANTAVAVELTLPVGAAGELTTRTDDDTGEITADSAGHGITTGDTVNVYWDGGVQYGCTVGTVSGTAIPIDTGSGDNLPTLNSDVVVTKVVTAAVTLDGDNAQLIAIEMEDNANGSDAGHVRFEDSGDSEIAELDLVANVPQTYDLAAGISNPFTGNVITEIIAANGSSANAATLKVLALIDN